MYTQNILQIIFQNFIHIKYNEKFNIKYVIKNKKMFYYANIFKTVFRFCTGAPRIIVYVTYIIICPVHLDGETEYSTTYAK